MRRSSASRQGFFFAWSPNECMRQFERKKGGSLPLARSGELDFQR